MGTYTTKSKSRKWTRVALAYILDTIRVNSSTVVTLNSNSNPKPTDNFRFGYELATQLLMPHIQRRSRHGLSSEVMTNPKQCENPSRCRQCIRNSYGQDPNVTRNKLKKIKTACESCGDAFCNEHLIYVCKECYRKVRK